MKLSSNFKILLKTNQSKEDNTLKRKMVFKILMFLAFIDGLTKIIQFNIETIQCKGIMEFMFNCNIFDNLFTLVRCSSLEYYNFLDIKKGFEYKLPILTHLTESNRYTGLCNIILDNICSRIAGLLSDSCKQRYTSIPAEVGGKRISKKIYLLPRKSSSSTRRRRPSRKYSATKRRRPRRPRRRTSRK